MMKKLKKIVCSLLVVVMCLTAAPLQGFVGLEWPEWSFFSAKAGDLAATGQCGENVYWSFDELTGKLIISGEGKMWDYNSNVSPFYYNLTILSVEIQKGVTSIGDCVFHLCFNLASVTIPDSVTSIGNHAFYGCTSLTSITIPDSVTSIGDEAFARCTGLTSVTIPNSVTSIGIGAFDECKSLTRVAIPDSVISIGYHAFYGCTSLTSITIPDSVTSIGDKAFAQCTGLRSVTIPNSVTSIGICAFDSCNNLTDVYYTDSENQWNTITIGGYNDPLLNATIHFNYCAHANKLYVATKYPTCTEAGEMKMQCQDCKAYLDDVQVLPATGHTPRILAAKEATCEKAGLTEGKQCIVCGEVYEKQETIPALGHNEIVAEPAVAKTCITDGRTQATKCGRCGIIMKKSEVIPAGHELDPSSWKVTKEATCTEEGIKMGYCTVCKKESQTVVIPATGHTPRILAAKEATCEKAGLTEGKQCIVCGEVYEKQETIPALGHKYGDYIVTKKATCFAAGQKEAVCATCGQKDIQNIAKLPHTEVKTEAVPATCTEKGTTEGSICSVCGTVIKEAKDISPVGHDWIKDESKSTPATCITVGKDFFECSRCKATEEKEVPTAGHTEQIVEAVPATCTETGLTEGKICKICGEILVAQESTEALGHDLGEWIVTMEETCTENGEKAKQCSRCSYTETDVIPAGHKFSEWKLAKECSCVEDGTLVRMCRVCDEMEVQTTPAYGHTYGEWNELLPATCQERGVNARVCLNCGTMDREIIPVQDHKDDDGDDYCDWCGSFVGEVPDFPDIDDCSCNCHKGGLAGFFFRLINFFQKLFGQNKVCACGASH